MLFYRNYVCFINFQLYQKHCYYACRQKEIIVGIDTAIDAAITLHIEQLRNNRTQTGTGIFGLSYNPFGEERDTYAFNPPMNIFNFVTDNVVLIWKRYVGYTWRHGML